MERMVWYMGIWEAKRGPGGPLGASCAALGIFLPWEPFTSWRCSQACLGVGGASAVTGPPRAGALEAWPPEMAVWEGKGTAISSPQGTCSLHFQRLHEASKQLPPTPWGTLGLAPTLGGEGGAASVLVEFPGRPGHNRAQRAPPFRSCCPGVAKPG